MKNTLIFGSLTALGVILNMVIVPNFISSVPLTIGLLCLGIIMVGIGLLGLSTSSLFYRFK